MKLALDGAFLLPMCRPIQVVDRESRDRLALALRRYVSCRISNDELHEIEVDSRDSGALVVQSAAWLLYDDVHTHYAVGKFAIPRSCRRELARWVLFLRSEDEYLWPNPPAILCVPAPVAWLLNLATVGWWGRRSAEALSRYTEGRDLESWPFKNEASETEARQRFPF